MQSSSVLTIFLKESFKKWNNPDSLGQGASTIKRCEGRGRSVCIRCRHESGVFMKFAFFCKKKKERELSRRGPVGGRPSPFFVYVCEIKTVTSTHARFDKMPGTLAPAPYYLLLLLVKLDCECLSWSCCCCCFFSPMGAF